MRSLYLLLSVLVVLSASVHAQEPTWLNIFKKENGKDRVTALPLDSVSKIAFNKPDETADFYNRMSIIHKNGRTDNVMMDNVVEYSLGTNVPTIYINTDPVVSEITSKSDYLPASFSMNCYGEYDEVKDVGVNIRGRGNTTWSYAKKPYRLKFDKKISLCGLKKAKNYVLIANYIDNTLMKNAIAFKIGQLLEMPYTNHSIPVNVVLNGTYRGAYMLSEKVGINSGSVDIDEEAGIMWEMDAYYDEDFKFKSKLYKLPVMVKDPDFMEIAQPAEGQTVQEAANELLQTWRTDFEVMEASVKNGNPETTLDMEQAVNYILASTVVRNGELNWPKSIYLFKENAGALYKFGPLWDYDWAYNFVLFYDTPLLLPGDPNQTGVTFFLDFVKSAAFKEAFAVKWASFKSELFPQVLEYIDSYADTIRVSALQNGERWPGSGPDGNGWSSEDFDKNVADLKTYLIKRVEYMDNDSHWGIY